MTFAGLKLLMLGAGYFQVPAIRKAQQLGLEVIAISNIPTDPGLEIADKGIVLSTLNKEAILRLAETEKINGVLTVASEAAAPTAAFVAENLHLPGYTYKAAVTIANKLYLRQALQQAGISNIRFADASTPQMAAAAMANLSRPLMLKPLFSSGSRGIQKINTKEELDRCLESTIKESFVYEGALLEEFVSGIPLSGELLICEGKIIAHAFSQKTYNRHFVTTSHCMPAHLPVGQTNALLSLSERIITALHLKNGALDLDLVLTETGIEVIELGGRLGGNAMAELAGLHTGLDFTEAAIRIALGQKIAPPPLVNQPVAVHIISSPRQGKLKQIKQFKEVFPEEAGNLVSQSTFFAAGSPVWPLTQGNYQLGTIIFKAATPVALAGLLQKIQAVAWAEVE